MIHLCFQGPEQANRHFVLRRKLGDSRVWLDSCEDERRVSVLKIEVAVRAELLPRVSDPALTIKGNVCSHVFWQK